MENHDKVVELLLKSGADVNEKQTIKDRLKLAISILRSNNSNNNF